MKIWIALILCLFLFPWAVQSAEYYRWTDENGVSHITDQPPAKAKQLKTYRFKNQAQPVAPDTANAETTPSTVTENQPSETETPQASNPELEQTRSEYEELKANEDNYRRNYNSSYGNKKERDYWRDRLNDVENKRQKLESLESGESSGEGSSKESSEASGGENPR